MSDYERILEQIHSQIAICRKKYDTSLCSFYYRGQSNNQWKLLPSCKRPQNKMISESFVMEKAQKEGYWDSSRSIVENIAVLQHYGYPTRYLDFTTNIDVALYFACSAREDMDGAFYIFIYYGRECSHVDSIVISELALLDREIPLVDFSRKLLCKYPEYESKYYDVMTFGMNILSWIDHGFMVAPTEAEREKFKIFNPRVYNQCGAFYVFGNKTKEPVHVASTIEADHCVIMPEVMDDSDVFNRHHIIGITVPKVAKKNILNALIKKGISESFIYPDKDT